MELLKWKIRISILWIILVVNQIASMLLLIIVMKDPPFSNGLGLTIWLFITCALAYLSLTLKNSANRWTNLVLGVLFIIAKIRFLERYFTASDSYAVLITYIWGILAAALIVWHVWKWPKQEA